MVQSAIRLALNTHKDEIYDCHPYSFHINQVYQLACQYYPHDDYIQALALLHDKIESDIGKSQKNYESMTQITLFCRSFHLTVDVELLTDKSGENRKERHQKTYPLLARSKAAVSVKLLDRLANVSYSKVTGDMKKLKMYKKEHPYLVQTLNVWDDLIHEHIIQRIEDYFVL